MGEELKDWVMSFGAKVQSRNDMPDDMLQDAIETSQKAIQGKVFETEGWLFNHEMH